ncbi:MerR family transcriptional regulator [Streptomyces qinglanensis]|uniref:MerR family transcriptional regulator n=1 Tax=Streptomyces qinglanensis TaxID=943816 RepID=A0A1E7KB41_9ACTN|nr:MerR family transcriptional regulator [Streptomyces qinglanensis]OEV01074.1 MerR family transcriptional regulator [Streptomyces qinglanensis]OEV23821.1 MerR family transcriptional regulator [Streptomyces nanshensis]
MTQPENPPTSQPRAPARCAEAPRTGRRPEGQHRYTISEAAELSGLSAHTLRWYERIGLMPHVDRSHSGQRRFSDRDLNWLDLVGKLRLTGMPVADMVRYAEMVRQGEQTFGERKALLEATREDVLARIAELHDTLEVLDYKIDHYSRSTGDLPATRAVMAPAASDATAEHRSPHSASGA